MDPFSIAQLAMTGASLLGGLFSDSGRIDRSPYVNQVNRLNRQASQMFDTGSSYYKGIANQTNRSLLDMYYQGVREQRKQLATQGINSNTLAGDLNTQALRKAGSNTAAAMNDMYQRGAQIGANLYGQAGQALQSLAGIDATNAETSASMKNQLLTMGLNYFAGDNSAGFNRLFGIQPPSELKINGLNNSTMNDFNSNWRTQQNNLGILHNYNNAGSLVYRGIYDSVNSNFGLTDNGLLGWRNLTNTYSG